MTTFTHETVTLTNAL